MEESGGDGRLRRAAYSPDGHIHGRIHGQHTWTTCIEEHAHDVHGMRVGRWAAQTWTRHESPPPPADPAHCAGGARAGEGRLVRGGPQPRERASGGGLHWSSAVRPRSKAPTARIWLRGRGTRPECVTHAHAGRALPRACPAVRWDGMQSGQPRALQVRAASAAIAAA